MKKILFLFSLFIFMMSCSKESSIDYKSETTLSSGIIKKSIIKTDTISTEAYKIGATKLVISGGLLRYETNNTFRYASQKSGVIRGLNLANYIFEVSGSTIKIKGSSSSLTKTNGVNYYTLGSFTGPIEKIPNDLFGTPDAFLLLTVRNELNLQNLGINGASTIPGGPHLVVASYTPPIIIGFPCSIADTYTCVGIGASPAGAKSNCRYNFETSVENDSYAGCIQTGEMEPGVLSGGLVQTISFCCPGSRIGRVF